MKYFHFIFHLSFPPESFLLFFSFYDKKSSLNETPRSRAAGN